MTRYLSRTEVAERIGVVPGALSRYRLPEPDSLTGKVRGWLPETIDRWHAARPGQGARTDLVSVTARRDDITKECWMRQHQSCGGYIEPEADPELCNCQCHDGEYL